MHIRHAFAWLRTLRGARADLASAGLGALSALALPPLHLLPALLLAVPGLLALLDGTPNRRMAARRGFWFGFGHHVPGLYWITEAILFEAEKFWWMVPLAVPALAAVLAVFIAATCWTARLAPRGWPRVFALAGAWVLADLARQFVFTGFPWNPWGADWAIPGPVGDIFIQPAAWVGVHGLTLATLLLAAMPVFGWRGLAAGAALLLAWGGLGLTRLRADPPNPPGITAVLVQGNIVQGRKFDQAAYEQDFRIHLDLTRRAVDALAGKPGVVIWPESASPFLLDRDANARAAIDDAAQGLPGLIGGVRVDADRRPFNSLIALNGAGPPAAIYDKWHLVPFGEFEPSWLPLQIVPGGGFAPGPGPRTLHLPGLPAFAALICYEAIFPGQVIDRADRPAMMVNITNDSWFGNSSGPRQHLAASRLRAVEEGLPLLRAANTGISAGFDGFGQEIGRLGMQERGTLALDLPGALTPTMFSQLGLAVPLALGLGSLLAGLAGARRRTHATPAIRQYKLH